MLWVLKLVGRERVVWAETWVSTTASLGVENSNRFGWPSNYTNPRYHTRCNETKFITRQGRFTVFSEVRREIHDLVLSFFKLHFACFSLYLCHHAAPLKIKILQIPVLFSYKKDSHFALEIHDETSYCIKYYHLNICHNRTPAVLRSVVVNCSRRTRQFLFW